MRLEQVRVQNYKCIEDSDWVELERVACLVGKNEAGKTAFLEALEKLNPVNSSGEYDPLFEYPRRRHRRYMRNRHEDDPDPVASAKFELSQNEVDEIGDVYGEGVLTDTQVVVTKDYQNNVQWELETNDDHFVQNLLETHELHPSTAELLEDSNSLDELAENIAESGASSPEFNELRQIVNRVQELGLPQAIGEDIVIEYLPEFFYFDEYSIMEGDVNVDNIIERRSQGALTDADETFLSLLSLAGLNLEQLRNARDYERITAELEAASIQISDDVFQYWSQGPDLEVEFDISGINSPTLHVRVENTRHRVSVPFDERSSGFIWFFSFLAYFSDLEAEDRELVLLLDEPGLNLHAKAQYDFLRFINERLAPDYQVVYTTHSPFMLEPNNLHRARLVMDDPEEGTRISSDILGSDEDTVFPLQAVLGYDLIQTLLIGPQCLLVEGKSDMTYLQVMSDILDERDRTALSHRWTIVPVGGADSVPTFVSLFGANNLDIGVLLDDDGRVDQRMADLEARGIFDTENVRTITGYREGEEGDIEDLFSREFYLVLVSAAYELALRGIADVPDEIEEEDLESEHPRITRQLEIYFDRWHINEGVFEHQQPASHFQKNREEFANQLDEDTIDRFEEMFEDLNSIIE